MEEDERKSSSDAQSQKPPSSNHASNGKPAGSGKVASPTQHGAGDGFMGVAAKILSSKAKRKASARDSPGKTDKHNGCDDDLPLGSEAHSLSLDYATNAESKYPLGEEKSSKWRRTASQAMMGWQSFNSDVSNQTSASSASLEQLLNDRQVDPEQMLLSLGFGGESQSLMPTLARVPLRFLHHPSRAYGIAPTGLSEEDVEDSVDAAAPAQLPAQLPGKAAPAAPATAAAAPQARKRSGIWTLAKTLSTLRLKTNSSRGNMSPTSNSSGTQQPQANQLVSVLNPANQRYLASRGFYEKQGWPKGTYTEPEDDSLHAVKEEVESKDAALKRKMFKKTRPHRNWSICDSEENDAFSGGNEWISKSADDYRSRDDFTGQDDSLGRGTYFSTTTESSTDSLETPNLETERAFENIRREYERNRQDRSSSDDLFLPSRKKRLSSEVVDSDGNLGSDHGLDLLGFNMGNTNYFVSPASSRQATVEKAPTISDQSPSVNLNDDGVDNCGAVDMPEDVSRLEGRLSTFPSDQTNRRLHYTDEDGKGDVRIIISTSENRDDRHWSLGRNHHEQDLKSSRLVVKSAQTASSDSGSSSATAVGSGSSTLTADKSEQRHPSESENSATDFDSISRTNSPHSFGRRSDMISASCQTTDTDFNIAAATNQNVNVSTMTTNNRSVLFVQINGSGHSSPTQERTKSEYTVIQPSPKVQLSTIPPTINHLELMKRLQHSQNELSRMGSLQSDSSGFGDADPALEPDSVKLASLGSSLESCRTLASSTATTVVSVPRTEEMATQTTLDSSQFKAPRDAVSQALEESRHDDRDSPKATGKEEHYVTMCYIPSLTSRANESAAVRHRPQPMGDDGSVVSYQDGGSSAWRSRLGRETRHPADTHQEINNNGHQPPGVKAGSRGPEPGRCFVRAYTQPSLGNFDLYKHHKEPRRQTGHYNAADWQPRSKRTFTSQIDLFTNAHGFSSHEASLDTHTLDSNVNLRRHSDEGILDSRNTAPLSIELALAKTSGFKPQSPQQSPFSSSRTITTKSTVLTGHDNSALMTPTDSQTGAGFHFSLIAGNISSFPSQQVSDKPINSYVSSSRSTSRQRSCDILDDDLEDRDSIMTRSHSKYSDDLDASSPMTERSSDFSVQSAPDGHVRTGVLESRKLTRLINQPIYFMGARRWGQLYQPNHAFKDWSLLGKRKRHQEENTLAQTAIQKYKTELTILEASLMVDCQAAYPDMTESEKEELKELEWLWNEVKGQVLEIERTLTSRVKALHAGNEFYSLISGLGVISEMVELIKEQICQQQMASGRTEEARDRSMDDDIFEGEISRHHSFQSSQGWFAGMGQMSTPRSGRKFQSSSTSHLPHELNISLEKIKSSVLSQVQGEIKESTKKFEEDLQEKDREIKKLQEQLLSRSLSLPDQQPRRWSPKSSVSSRSHAKPRSPKVKGQSSQETDV